MRARALLPEGFTEKEAYEWFVFMAQHGVRVSPCMTKHWSAQAFTDVHGILAVRGQSGPIEALRALKANIERHEKEQTRRGPPRR